MPEPKKLDTWKCSCPECKSGKAVPLEAATKEQLEAATHGQIVNKSLLPNKYLKHRITWMNLEEKKAKKA